MLAMALLQSHVAEAIVADTLFSPDAGDEWECILFKNNPTIGVDTEFGDLEEADFDGYARIPCGAGAIGMKINPVTGNWEIRPKEPLGGFEFTVSGITDLPQTIYGFGFVKFEDNVLFAAETFEAPIVLTAILQVIDVPQPIMTLPFNALT